MRATEHPEYIPHESYHLLCHSPVRGYRFWIEQGRGTHLSDDPRIAAQQMNEFLEYEHQRCNDRRHWTGCVATFDENPDLRL